MSGTLTLNQFVCDICLSWCCQNHKGWRNKLWRELLRYFLSSLRHWRLMVVPLRQTVSCKARSLSQESWNVNLRFSSKNFKRVYSCLLILALLFVSCWPYGCSWPLNFTKRTFISAMALSSSLPYRSWCFVPSNRELFLLF